MIDVSATLQFPIREHLRTFDRNRNRLLVKFGAFTRRDARSSIKKAPGTYTKSGRKKNLTRYGQQSTYKSGAKRGQLRFVKGKYSAPGRPPFWRTTNEGLRDIRFHVDRRKGDVLVGPLRYNSAKRMSGRTAPNIHEHGGRVTMRGTFARKGNKSIQSRYNSRRRTVTYPQRPYMGPAGDRAYGDTMRKANNQNILSRKYAA